MGAPFADVGASLAETKSCQKFSWTRPSQESDEARMEEKPRRRISRTGASAPPKNVVLDESERQLAGVKCAVLDWLPALKGTFKISIENPLVQSERDFDGYDGWHNLAVRTHGGFELPAPDGFDGFLFQAKTWAFHNGDVGGAAIYGDRHLQHHRALILGFARLVGILRDRAIQANWYPNAVHARAKRAAARAAALAGAETPAGAAADAGAIAVTERIRVRGSERVTECRHIRTRNFQVWRTQQRGIHGQFRIQILNLHLRWSKLRPLEFGQFPFVHRSQGVVVGAATAPGFVRAGRQLRDIGRNVERHNVHIALRLNRRRKVPEKRNKNDQCEDCRVEPHGNDLCPAEVFVLRPNLFHLYRFASHSQWRKLGWRERFLDAVEETAKVRSPIDCQLAVERPLGHRAGAQKLFQVLADSAAKRIARERCTRTFHDFHRALGQKLL